MANLDFKNTKILGVSQASKFIGGDVFRLSTTQTLEIEGFIKVPDGTWDDVTQVESNFSTIQNQINLMKADFLTGDGYSDITLNGVLMGNGRVLSLDFPASNQTTENSLAFGKYIATIEIYKKASSVNGSFASDTDIYDSASIAVIDLHALNIEEFSESFAFNVTEDDAYNYSQEISINLRKALSGNAEQDFGATVAQGIVSAILKQEEHLNAKLGYIDDRYKGYIQKIKGTAYFSENYNSVRGEYTFSRNLSILPNYETGGHYSAKITHAITMNNFGIFNIVESGEVNGMKGSASSRYTSAKDGANTLILAASGRCVDIYKDYKNKGTLDSQGYDVSAGLDLSPDVPEQDFPRKAIRTSKRFDSLAGTVSYEIEFTNDPKVLDGFMHEYTIEASKDSANITTITQRGTVTPYQNKNLDFDNSTTPLNESLRHSYVPTLKTKIAFSAIKGEINSFYDKVMGDIGASLSEYQMTNSSVSYPKWGISISYSKTFSDDEAILDPAKNNGIKRLSLRYNNGAPVRLKSTHLIPSVKENVYDADQISLGERSISINAIVERDFDNTNRIGKATQDKNEAEGGGEGKDAITFQRAKLNTGLKKIIKEAQVNLLFTNSKHIRPESYDIYPTQCNYSINSDNQIEFSLGAEYVFKDGRQVKDLGSFFVKDK